MNIGLRIATQAQTTTVSIFKDHASPTSYKEYTLSVARGEDEQRFIVPAYDDQLQSIFKAVHSARIAPIVEQDIMLDSDSYELIFTSLMGRTSYQWFGSAPVGWEDLGEIAHLVLRFAMRHTGAFYL